MTGTDSDARPTATMTTSPQGKRGLVLGVAFYGAEKLVTDCNPMGPVKDALEITVRYMAA